MMLRHVLPLLGAACAAAFQVNVKVTTGDGGSQHSRHTFPVELKSVTGETAPGMLVHEPDQGSMTYLVFEESPFPTEQASEVIFKSDGNDGWYIEKVEVMDKTGRWRMWGIEDMACKQGNWIEGDPNHHDYLAFSRCHEIDVRIMTGGDKNDGSIHNFEVELISAAGVKINPFPKVKSPNRYDLDLIRVVSPFPVNELKKVKIDDNGIDGWKVTGVEVQDEDDIWQQWGIPDLKCQHGAWVDYPGLFQGDGAITFELCTVPVQPIVAQIKVRVHTGPGLLSGSVHDFPISATSEKAHDFTVPVDVRAPSASSTQYIALDSTFPLNELSTIRIDHGGMDGWEVEGLEVEDEFGAWSYWGIKGMNCKKSSNIDGDSSHPKYLEFSKCNEIQVLIVTGGDAADGSDGDFVVEIVSASTSAEPSQTVVAPKQSGTDFVHAVATFKPSEVTEVRVKDAGTGDAWKVQHVSVADDAGKWQRWGHGAGCAEGGETTSDAAHPTYLAYTNCLGVSGGNQINLRLKVEDSPSSHSFPVTVHTSAGEETTVTVRSPVKAGWEYITIESTFPVSAVSRVHVGKGDKEWELDALEIEDEHMQWSMLGVQDRSCRAGDKLDDSGLTYVAACSTLEVLITTGQVDNAGSVHTYDVDLKSKSGSQVSPSPQISWPTEGRIDHIRTTGTFAAQDLGEVVIHNSGSDGWHVEELLVKNAKGMWDKWGLADHQCAPGGFVDSNGQHEKLVYTKCTPPSIPGTVYEIEVRITSGNQVLAGSSHDFPITVYDGTGQVSNKGHTHSPSSGEVFHRLLTAPFDAAHVKTLQIQSAGTDGWYVQSVEVRDEHGVWQLFGIEDMGCKRSEWVDKDKNHPTYLEFSRCHDLEVLVTTSLLSGADSIGKFHVELVSASGAKVNPVDTVSSPDIGQVDYFKSVSPFGVADLFEVRIDHSDDFLAGATNWDAWHIARVQVREADGIWYTWGIVPLGCQIASWLDEDSTHPKNVSWQRCTTPPPPTDPPCHIPEPVYEVDVRITTGNGASQHSHHTFPITVKAGTQAAPVQEVYEPDQGEVTYLVFDKSPFATEALTEVRIDAGGNDGWYIEKVEVKDNKGYWRVWGIEDKGCKQGDWVDGDSNHPAYLAFSPCHEINVRISTGGDRHDGSIHNFEVELFSAAGAKVTPYPKIKSPNRYDIDLIRVVSAFPVSELKKVKIDDNGSDGWKVTGVEVQDENGVWQQWGIPAMKCQHGAWVDYPGLFSRRDGAITFELCTVPVQPIVAQIKVRVHTGPGLLSGSVHDFPISAVSDTAHDFTVPVDVRAPSASSTQYIALDSTFPLNELSTIRIDHGGMDGWEVEGLEVEDEFGAWSYWGIKGMNCKKSSNIDGNSNHPKYLEFSKCNEIQVLIATGTDSAAGASGDYEVELLSKSGSVEGTYKISAPGVGGTDLVHAVATFPVGDLTEVRIKDNGDKDTWFIQSVHVLDANNVWQRWGWASVGGDCTQSGATTDDSSHPTYLSYTDCGAHQHTYQVNLRLKVEDSPSSHSFPVTVYSTLSAQAKVNIQSPVKAGWEYITIETPFPVTTVSSVHVGKGDKEWELDALEIEDEHMQWSMLGVQDRSCRAGDKLDDSGLTYVAACHTLEVLVTTGEVSNAGSVHTYDVDLKSKSGSQVSPSPQISWPTEGRIDHIRTTGTFAAQHLGEVVIHNSGTDGWHVEEVLVKNAKGMWEKWGLADHQCAPGGFVDSNGQHEKLVYTKCTPPSIPGTVYEIEVRVTGGSQTLAGSNHDFPITVYDANGQASQVVHCHSPSAGEVFYRIVKSPFPTSQVSKVKIQNGGSNAWYVESLEVRDAGHQWQYFGIEDMGCKRSSWVDKDKAHPSYLEYARCHDIEVLITTSLLDDAQSTGTYEIEFISNAGARFPSKATISSPHIGEHHHWKAVGPFGVEDLAEVRVDHDDHWTNILKWDAWNIERVQVWQDGKWITWGVPAHGCTDGSWIDDDSSHPKNVSFTRCHIADVTMAPCTLVPPTLAPFTYPPTPAPNTSAPDTDVPETMAPNTTAPDTAVPDTDAPPTTAPETNAPATPAPATDAPSTDAPATVAPDTLAPTNSPPGTTIAPDTDAPATDAPPTPAPATDAPATSAPATDAPATVAPDTVAPTNSPPGTSIAPATDAPATGVPATSAPATDAPTTDVPATGIPATNSPPGTSIAPATNAPATDAPATVVPATNSPPGTSIAPATDAPATSAPTTDAPATNSPPGTSIAPATDAPETDAPTAGSTTVAPVMNATSLPSNTGAPSGNTDSPDVKDLTPLPSGNTYSPDVKDLTPLPSGHTYSPDVKDLTPLPSGQTYSPDVQDLTPLPSGNTYSPDLNETGNTTDTATPGGAGLTVSPDAYLTALPEGQTYSPDSNSSSNATDTPASLTPLPSGHTYSPDFNGKDLTPLPSGQTYSPDVKDLTPLPSGHTYSPDFNGRDLTPLPSGQTYSPDVKDLTPLPSGHTYSPDFNGRDLTPLPSGHTYSPDFNGKDLTPLPSGQTYSPDVNETGNDNETVGLMTPLPSGDTYSPSLFTPLPGGETYVPGWEWLGAGHGVTPEPEVEDDDDNWWVWLLVALGILLLCSALFASALVMKKRRADQEDERNFKQFDNFEGMDQTGLLAGDHEEMGHKSDAENPGSPVAETSQADSSASSPPRGGKSPGSESNSGPADLDL